MAVWNKADWLVFYEVSIAFLQCKDGSNMFYDFSSPIPTYTEWPSNLKRCNCPTRYISRWREYTNAFTSQSRAIAWTTHYNVPFAIVVFLCITFLPPILVVVIHSSIVVFTIYALHCTLLTCIRFFCLWLLRMAATNLSISGRR